jgi:hypothetical protein
MYFVVAEATLLAERGVRRPETFSRCDVGGC